MIPTTTTPTLKVEKRLTIQTLEIAAQTLSLRCLDWDRDRFDIEFALNNGTTYNSFLIQGQKKALIDTSHIKFEELYLKTLREFVDLSTLDYLIISHTEPDHSGLVKHILESAPSVTVVASKVAIQFLENMVHQPFNKLIVKSGSSLDLGNGHKLEFISAPNLHWPDTIFTYDKMTHILFTCDAFGMHFCDDHIYDEEPEIIASDFKYYYDCLMGPNARSVLGAIKRIEDFPLETIATGHGPLLKYHLSDWVDNYQKWSEQQTQQETLVAIFYSEGYGYSDEMAKSIASGIRKTGVAIEFMDLTNALQNEVRELVEAASGIVILMPSQSDSTAQTALSTILAAVHPRQTVGLIESGGREDEPIYPLANKLQTIGLHSAWLPILLKESPNQKTEQLCNEAGTDMGQWLNRKQKKNVDTDLDLDRALGRISTGLYIITAKKGELSSAMLASWVTQASLNPLGVAIAVAKDRAIESLLHVGDRFVLNVLEENNYQRLMKHFLKRFAPGEDRFAGVKIYPANNGSPILADALSYMECEVTSRLECSDHWLVYSRVDTGRVAKTEALTAIHHRKFGSHY